MDIQALKLFVDAADLHSFTNAAVANFTTQPALSRKVAELEAYCGFKLFDRSRHPVELTEEGREVYALAVDLLRRDDELEQAVRLLRDGGGVSLKVAYTMGGHQEYLTRAFVRVKARYPRANLSAERVFAPQAFQMLGDGSADVVVCNAPEQAGHPGTASRSVMACGLVAFVPRDHPLAEKGSLRLADLDGQQLVTMARFGSPSVFDEMQRRCRRAGFEPVFAHMAPDTFTFSMMLSLHHQIGLMPQTTILTGTDDVAVLPLEDAGGFDLTAAWRADDPRGAVGALVQALTES